ncbi:MAG TPA: hypothetical protein VE715_21930 [Blastocatellia bacterium]|nr:hypothetical protein [Blastocatellia bacterium]
MANKINFTLLLLCAVSQLFAGAALAQERRTKIKVPPAVQKTVNEQSQGATIRGLSKELEKGRTQYELELTVNGHARDMIIDPTGAILEVEEEITLDSLSPAVRAEVEKNIGGAKLLRLESVTKGGALTGYEATVSRAGKKSGLEMGADGKPIPKEKMTK